jgi:hypothetical protein
MLTFGVARALVTLALASSAAAVIAAQSGTPTAAGASQEPCTVNTLLRQASNTSPQDGDALRILANQRTKWKAQQPTSYRLCVVTLNPLLVTITEADVVEGVIRVARQASNPGARKDRLDADDWAPVRGDLRRNAVRSTSAIIHRLAGTVKTG